MSAKLMSLIDAHEKEDDMIDNFSDLDSDVMVMESAEERMGANAFDPLNWARDRRALRSRRG